MTTLVKSKVKKSDEQTNIDKYRSKFIFIRMAILKFLIIKQLSNLKKVFKNAKSLMFTMDWRSGIDDRIASIFRGT